MSKRAGIWLVDDGSFTHASTPTRPAPPLSEAAARQAALVSRLSDDLRARVAELESAKRLLEVLEGDDHS